jgi:hypothetical protein
MLSPDGDGNLKAKKPCTERTRFSLNRSAQCFPLTGTETTTCEVLNKHMVCVSEFSSMLSPDGDGNLATSAKHQKYFAVLFSSMLSPDGDGNNTGAMYLGSYSLLFSSMLSPDGDGNGRKIRQPKESSDFVQLNAFP